MSLLTYEQAARELAVSKRTIERLVAEGQLEVVEVGAARRVRPEAVKEFVAARAVTRDRERQFRPVVVRASRGPSSFSDEWAAAS